ncbi:hypothetical protein Goari_017285 [Gossypium aridum]|uniref:Uncharacterized protein n=1 Tax=Gossypium aridum TaxID=34290 RepID=A0A7J8WLL2_GOSAI|nr:hypothetical protein [Gossypium aridum]
MKAMIQSKPNLLFPLIFPDCHQEGTGLDRGVMEGPKGNFHVPGMVLVSKLLPIFLVFASLPLPRRISGRSLSWVKVDSDMFTKGSSRVLVR